VPARGTGIAGGVWTHTPASTRAVPTPITPKHRGTPARPIRRIVKPNPVMIRFMLGLSTRKVGEALLPTLRQPVIPATVSAVANQPDAVVAAFHARLLKEYYCRTGSVRSAAAIA